MGRVVDLDVLMFKLNNIYKELGIIPSSTIIQKVGECNGIGTFKVIADITYNSEWDRFEYKLRGDNNG